MYRQLRAKQTENVQIGSNRFKCRLIDRYTYTQMETQIFLKIDRQNYFAVLFTTYSAFKNMTNKITVKLSKKIKNST